MDWVLALCIAAAFIIGLVLLLVIGFASGEDSVSQSHAHEVRLLTERLLELEAQCINKTKRIEELEALLKENESIRSAYAYNIRELAKELRDAKKGKGDFALDA